MKRKVEILLAIVGGVVVVLVLLGGVYLTVRLSDDEPVVWESEEDHFKYGSTGGERGWGKQFGFGIPYWVWVALPQLFPEYLPDGDPDRGYASFGMIYEEGRDPRLDLPVGMSMRRVQGIDRIYFTCSACHTGVVRSSPGAPPQVITGMPANTFDLGALADFLFRASSSWKFRSSRMFPSIELMEALQASREDDLSDDAPYRPDPLNPVDRMVFRYAGITLMREQLLTLTSRLSFVDMTSWGPGRVDTFNPPKALLGFPMQHASGVELVGTADFPSIWNQRWKAGMQLHWDGNNTSVDERNLSAAFGTGATPTTLDRESVLRIADWLWDVAEPPPYPESELDRDLASEGEPVYRAECWACHGNPRPPFRTEGDGGRVGTVTPIGEIGTDRARLDSYTPELAAAQNTLYAGFPEDEEACRNTPRGPDEARGPLECFPARFQHFRKTWGYANLPLDGLWLRAPYLHNGSVPTLTDLLEPPEFRPDSLWIGTTVYDFGRVGFVARGDAAEREGWLLDTRLPGNGNGGHLYGTDLEAGAKEALIEYLKTF